MRPRSAIRRENRPHLSPWSDQVTCHHHRSRRREDRLRAMAERRPHRRSARTARARAQESLMDMLLSPVRRPSARRLRRPRRAGAGLAAATGRDLGTRDLPVQFGRRDDGHELCRQSWPARAVPGPAGTARGRRARGARLCGPRMSFGIGRLRTVAAEPASAAVPAALSPEFFEVLYAGQRHRRTVSGAFDVSVAPLHAWGSGRKADRRANPPMPKPGGWPSTTGAAPRPAASHGDQATAGLQADLGGIAKGFGGRPRRARNRSGGCGNYMIEVRREVRTRGRNAEGRAWRVGIEEPGRTAAAGAPRRAASAAGSMATSGDYRTLRAWRPPATRTRSTRAPPAPTAHGLASWTVIAD